MTDPVNTGPRRLVHHEATPPIDRENIEEVASIVTTVGRMLPGGAQVQSEHPQAAWEASESRRDARIGKEEKTAEAQRAAAKGLDAQAKKLLAEVRAMDRQSHDRGRSW